MIEIQTNKLSDYLIENKLNLIDFLKIDTEGYEYEVLKGLEDKIKDVKIIMFEHHYDNRIKNIRIQIFTNFYHLILLNRYIKQKCSEKL